jgi:hypothetical protein
MPLATCPLPVTHELLERGRQRFGIFCSECHGDTGYADGIIVQRGFPQPPSYHTDAMRALPLGHFVHVITFGFGRMESYADRVPPADCWAIACWIRVLQTSQHVPVASLPAAEQQELHSIPTPMNGVVDGPAVPAFNGPLRNQSGLTAQGSGEEASPPGPAFKGSGGEASPPGPPSSMVHASGSPSGSPTP